MPNELYKKFAPVIQGLTEEELSGASSLYQKLNLATDGRIQICYAPFEYINKEARVVIVGITPGQTQMLNALREAKQQIQKGAQGQEVLKAAKSTGAFSGPMRPNLTNLLDQIGINRWLGLSSCSELFGAAARLVQTTSILRNPVFINGENYNGTPNMIRTPLLRQQIIQHFGEDASALPNAVFIPLGDKVAEALKFLASQGLIRRDRILDGLPHPSGANAERIAYFIGKKAREALSAKTDPDKLDQARISLIGRVGALSL